MPLAIDEFNAAAGGTVDWGGIEMVLWLRTGPKWLDPSVPPPPASLRGDNEDEEDENEDGDGDIAMGQNGEGGSSAKKTHGIDEIVGMMSNLFLEVDRAAVERAFEKLSLE